MHVLDLHSLSLGPQRPLCGTAFHVIRSSACGEHISTFLPAPRSSRSSSEVTPVRDVCADSRCDKQAG